MNNKSDNKRLVSNTLFLYFRSIFTMAVGIFTSRVILQALGIENYGIYNVVAGFVTMFAIVSSTFTSSTQRFLSFELGRKEIKRAQDVFSLSMMIHIGLCFAFLLVAETIGLYFLNNGLNIHSDRLIAANVVYQCSIVTFIFDLLSVPYNASIIANENMKVFAYISIFEVTMKLVILYLLHLFNYDILIVYAILLMAIAIIIRFTYSIYCNRHFPESKFKICKDKHLFKEMMSISGWNFLGSGATVFTFQGINILINIVGGGVIINAAKGVASQVENAVSKFTDNFMTSIDPQITKAYSAGDSDRLFYLMDKGSRFSFFLLAFICMPIILESKYILTIWLKAIPQYADYFVSLSLILILSRPFSTIADKILLATGKIKRTQIILSCLQLCDIPLSYFILVEFRKPYYFYSIFIFIAWVSLFVRYYFVCHYIGIKVSFVFKTIILRCLIVLLLSLIIPIILRFSMHDSFLRFSIVSFSSVICMLNLIFFVGIDSSERQYFINKIVRK